MKCPHCDKYVANLKVEAVDGHVTARPAWKAIALCCPMCNSMISAQIDPIAVRTEIVRQVEDLLKKHR